MNRFVSLGLALICLVAMCSLCWKVCYAPTITEKPKVKYSSFTFDCKMIDGSHDTLHLLTNPADSFSFRIGGSNGVYYLYDKDNEIMKYAVISYKRIK